MGISIHALLAESDTKRQPGYIALIQFLSTLSLRRATLAGPSGPAFLINFYPRSPCGERLGTVITYNTVAHFYPRSPCGERRFGTRLKCLRRKFLSTLSLRRATLTRIAWEAHQADFYPRSPCGERRLHCTACMTLTRFLSTLSLRRATLLMCSWLCGLLFLSTLSLRRATREPTALRTPHHIFLSTLSLRRATQTKGFKIPAHGISIHALLAESDPWGCSHVILII